MARIRRHETVTLDTGGWIDLKGCDVLWAPRPFMALRGKHYWFPGGVFFARKNAWTLLLRTPQGRLIVKSEERLPPETPVEAIYGVKRKRIAWREVSPEAALLWLQQQKHSRSHARRLFPELTAQQRKHKLGGER